MCRSMAVTSQEYLKISASWSTVSWIVACLAPCHHLQTMPVMILNHQVWDQVLKPDLSILRPDCQDSGLGFAYFWASCNSTLKYFRNFGACQHQPTNYGAFCTKKIEYLMKIASNHLHRGEVQILKPIQQAPSLYPRSCRQNTALVGRAACGLQNLGKFAVF